MENPIQVTIGEPKEKLIKEVLKVNKDLKNIYLHGNHIELSIVGINKLLQIGVRVFKHQNQFLFGVEDIVKSSHQKAPCERKYLTILGCLSSFKSDISRMAVQGTLWAVIKGKMKTNYPFLFIVKSDSLQGNEFICIFILGFVDDTVGA